MPIFKGFRSTTIPRAFFLGALISSIIIVMAIVIKDAMDRWLNKHNVDKSTTNVWSVLLTFAITFAATYGSYWLMYLLFGYGGGLLAD